METDRTRGWLKKWKRHQRVCAPWPALCQDKKGVTAFMLLYEKTHTGINRCDKFVLPHSFTVPLREKQQLIWNSLLPFTRRSWTRGVKVRSNPFAAPQVCAQTCWDPQGAVALCFVSLLLRHNCAQRPGKFHSLSGLEGSGDTHDRKLSRAFGVIKSYLLGNYKIGFVKANNHFKFLS